VIEQILASSLRLSIPLLFAAYGGLLSERSGVANIALEAQLLLSAFTAAAVTSLSGNLWLGSAAGVLAAGFGSMVFAVICIWGRGDQIVVGTGFNLLVMGLVPLMCKSVFAVSGSTPSLPAALTFHHSGWFFALALLSLALLEFLLRKTRHGLRIQAAGENPEALIYMGVDARWVRLRAVTEGGLLVGLGGVYLSLCQGSGFVREMSGGRGFIALAALIFGGWRPIPTFLACGFFGLLDALQMQWQGREIAGVVVPNQFVQILPYVVTLVVLALFRRKMQAPAAINRPLEPSL
jgi:ABC-type uncharacterized transport system permease subunit